MPRVRFFGGGGGGGAGWGSSSPRHNEYMKNAAACKSPSASIGCGSGGGDDVQLPDGYDYFMNLPLHRRCGLAKKVLGKVLRCSNKLDPSEVLFFNKYLDGCPDTPDLKKLYENGGKETRAKKEARCKVFLRERARVMSEQNQELTASQIAFFKTWLDDCPNAASDLHRDSQ